MKKKSLLFLMLLLCFASFNARAQQYGLDTSFSIGSGFNSFVYSSTSQPDGKIIVVGDFTTYNGSTVGRIVRLNPDGTIDTTFNTGTGTDNTCIKVVLQSDGKILIAGRFTSFNGTTVSGLARLNANGSLDTTFSIVNINVAGYISEIIFQSDGKIIIAGSFTSFNGVSTNRIARLNVDGTRDTSFVIGTGFNNVVNDLQVLQQDGKLIVGGAFTSYNGTSVNRIARLHTDGSLDTSFNSGGFGANGAVRCIAIESDGKILVAGSFVAFNFQAALRIVRLNADGTFNTGLETGANASIYDIKVQPDNKILLAGDFSSYNSNSSIRCLARLNADLSLDTSFSYDSGVSLGSVIISFAISGTKLFIGGLFSTFNGSSSNNFAIISPSQIQPLVVTPYHGDLTCFGNNSGYAEVTVEGGVPPYTYYWGSAGSTDSAIYGLSAYTYDVTVTDSAGTSVVRYITVSQPARGTVTTISQTNVTCNGGLTGSATFSVSGGVSPYFFNGNSFTESYTVTGLPAGTSYLYFTDAAGCPIYTDGVTITQPTAITISLQFAVNVACNGGSTGIIGVNVSGGTAPYTYSWNGGGSSATKFNLAAGVHTVTVIDSRGCEATRSFTITEPAALIASVGTQTNVGCYGAATGSATVLVTGGEPSYFYSWSGGGNSATKSGLSPGSHIVNVTDSNGCTTSKSFTITQPAAALTANTAVTHVSCFEGSDGAIILTPTGGTLPYSYNWENGTATKDRENLIAGSYSVVVTDSNGCTTNTTAIINQSDIPPSIWYLDADNDGYSSSALVPAPSITSCTRPVGGYKLASELANAGVGSIGTDCLDSNQYANPGAQEICYDGIDNDCDGSLLNGCPNITTTFWTTVCGYTLPALNTSIRPYYTFVGSLPSGVTVTGYRFMVTNLTSNQTRVVETINSLFRITDTNIASYGTNYSIKVSIKLNDEWQDYNIESCTVTTPSIPSATVLNCGTLAAINSPIYTTSVANARNYRYVITLMGGENNDVPTVYTQTFTRTSNFVRLTELTTVPILYNAVYKVEISAESLFNNVYSFSGAGTCYISSPFEPELQYTSCIDGRSLPDTMATPIYVTPFAGSPMYRYIIENDLLGYSKQIETTLRFVRLSQFNALGTLIPGETYKIRIQAQLYGVYYEGKDCQVTVPGGPPPVTTKTGFTFQASAYPNPFANNFMIAIKTGSQSVVNLKVYDMIGRLIEQREARVSDLETTTIGDRYPSGVYNVVVSQEDNVQTVRVVKR